MQCFFHDCDPAALSDDQAIEGLIDTYLNGVLADPADRSLTDDGVVPAAAAGEDVVVPPSGGLGNEDVVADDGGASGGGSGSGSGTKMGSAPPMDLGLGDDANHLLGDLGEAEDNRLAGVSARKEGPLPPAPPIPSRTRTRMRHDPVEPPGPNQSIAPSEPNHSGGDSPPLKPGAAPKPAPALGAGADGFRQNLTRRTYTTQSGDWPQKIAQLRASTRGSNGGVSSSGPTRTSG